MSIYIRNDLEDRLKALEAENVSDLHVDSSFHKQSIKLDNYLKIEEWFNSSLGQSTVIQ